MSLTSRPATGGSKPVTLCDAASYITALPEKDPLSPKWQAAIEALMLLVDSAAQRCSRVGVMKALNRGHVREFNLSRKDPHWGRRKLARDR